MGLMTLDEKIRLGILALSTVTTVVIAAHIGGHVIVKPPFLDEIGGGQGG
ncbi:MAG: hypothetical protein ACYCQJ_03455 [Nitrososphaerales archaeon]